MAEIDTAVASRVMPLPNNFTNVSLPASSLNKPPTLLPILELDKLQSPIFMSIPPAASAWPIFPPCVRVPTNPPVNPVKARFFLFQYVNDLFYLMSEFGKLPTLPTSPSILNSIPNSSNFFEVRFNK